MSSTSSESVMSDVIPRYWKALIALVPVVLFVGTEVVQAIQNASADGLEMKDVLAIVVTACTAYAVYKKANAPLVA